MSRIRSQLDTVMSANNTATAGGHIHHPAEPRPAFAPRQHSAARSAAPAVQAAQPSQTSRDLDALHNSLAQLSQKIASLPQQTAHQSAAASTAAAHDQSAALGQMRDTVVGELRSGFGAFRSDLAQNRSDIAQSFADGLARSEQAVASGVAQSLSGDLQRISDGIARLQESNGMHPDYVDQMQAELGSLNAGIGQLLNRPSSQVDLSGVSAAIESNYSDIVNKLDSVLANRGSELPVIDIPDYADQLNNINDRLDEVTRAVVTLTVNPDNTSENHAFERIEARLASLSKSVDEIMERGPAQPALQTHMGETISAQISKLSEKLDNMDAMGAAGDALGTQIFPDVQEIANRIDSLQNDFGVLAANLEQGLASVPQPQLEASAPMPQPVSDEALMAIENRLGELAQRFDQMGNQPEESSNATGQEILYVLREVVDRIDNLESAPSQVAAPVMPEIDDNRFGALENQLAGISAQLGSLSTTPEIAADFTPITERLDHIEGQIASSRDIVIDIATEAAQKAVASGGSSEESQLAIASVLEELRAIRAEQAEAGAKTSSSVDAGQITEIGTTMAAIADRISNIEQSVQSNAAAPVEQASVIQQYAAQAAVAEDSYTGQQATAYEPAQPDFDLPDNRAMPVSEPQYNEPPYSEPQYTGEAVPSIEDAPSIDMSEGATEFHGDAEFGAPVAEVSADTDHELHEKAEVEDVPLAPGSGMPDLEALVKRATSRKKSGNENGQAGEEPVDEGISDLMAAARRAAQAASIEAETSREADPKGKKTGLGGKKLPKFSAPAFLSKKTLMMTAAVIALAVGGLTLAPRLFGSSDSATQISALEETGSGEAIVDSAPEGEVLNGETETTRIIDMNEEAGEETETSRLLSPDEGAAAPLNGGNEADIAPGSMTSDEGTTPASLNTDNGAAMSELPSEELGNLAFRQAVAAGDGNALFEAGKRYTDGQLVPRDLKQAVKWYTMAAEAGHAPAQYRLGNFYEKGHGVEAIPAKAVEWYSKAAEQGNALAMHNLAVLNAMGVVSGDANMDAAINWFEKAANLGVKDSQVNLGILYTKGMGVQEDLEKAYKWFAIASKGGDSDASKKRDTVAQAMRPEQLEKARGAAEIWKPAQLDAAANVARVLDEWNPGGQKKAMSKAEMVRMTQALLSQAGYDAGPADGKMGNKTRNAIISFQKANGLKADGVITPELMDALTKVSI